LANPWSKKNPFMSLWLSGANAAVGRAGGHARAAAKRTQSALTKKAAALWTDAMFAPFKPRRRKKPTK
jgi:truncated hemoglobin YjbI